MKTKIVCLSFVCLLACPSFSSAQSAKDNLKQRKELLKMNRDLQGEKVSKTSR